MTIQELNQEIESNPTIVEWIANNVHIGGGWRGTTKPVIKANTNAPNWLVDKWFKEQEVVSMVERFKKLNQKDAQ
jgi:hypothetical protein